MRCRTKYGSIAQVNWHRDGLVGLTHLTDGANGEALKGLSNVYREDEVEFLDEEPHTTLADLRALSDEELRQHLIALRMQRREVPQKPRETKPRASRPAASRRDPAEALRQQIAALSPEDKEALRRLLKGE